MAWLLASLSTVIIPYRLLNVWIVSLLQNLDNLNQAQQAQTLEWDSNEHSSFSLTFNHNMSQTVTLNQIDHNEDVYDLVDPIVITATGSSTSIRAFMSFKDPIDDIKQAEDNSTLYRLSQYDYQSVTKTRIQALLNSVHDGTLEYDTATVNHLLLDGTLQNAVYFKNYPITASVWNIT